MDLVDRHSSRPTRPVMMTSSRHALAAALLVLTAATAQEQRLWSIPISTSSPQDSRVNTSPPSDLEAADDFDVHGVITRVVAQGKPCGSCITPPVSGATVRFYADQQGSVGALSYERFVPSGSDLLSYDPRFPSTVDVTLPLAFQAQGRHWVSVQLHFVGAGYWAMFRGNPNAPRLATAQVRDRVAGGPWQTPTTSTGAPLLGDLAYELWGLLPGSTGEPAVPCVTWSLLDADPIPNSLMDWLKDVKVFGLDDAWAVGDVAVQNGVSRNRLTTVLHWDGRRYSLVSSPSPGPTPSVVDCYLDAVDGTSGSDLWVGGTYKTQIAGGWVGFQVFAMHYDGSSWTIPLDLPVPTSGVGGGVSGSGIDDLVSIAPNDAWFVGDWIDIQSIGNPIQIRPGLLLHYDGSALNQTILPVVTGVGHQYFTAVDAVASNVVWLVGGAGNASSQPGSNVPVVFEFDGASWHHRPFAAPPGDVSLHDVEVVSANEVYVFGVSVDRSTVPRTTTEFMARWNGSAWTLLPAPPFALDAKMFSATEGRAVGPSIWSWDGSSWQESFDLQSAATGRLLGVDGLSACELFAVGQGTRGQGEPFVMRQDNARAWNVRTRTALLPARAPVRLAMREPPRPGHRLEVALDDPGGVALPAPATSLWFLGVLPAPVGVVLPFGGVAGGPGELLLDLSTLIYVSGPTAVPAGGAALHGVPVPTDPALLGAPLSSQGVLLGSGGGGPVYLSNALDMQLGL